MQHVVKVGVAAFYLHLTHNLSGFDYVCDYSARQQAFEAFFPIWYCLLNSASKLVADLYLIVRFEIVV